MMKTKKKRGKAPPFPAKKGSTNGVSDDMLRPAKAPPPAWMNDPSLLPKRPPGRP